jgi:hypothetical protein
MSEQNTQYVELPLPLGVDTATQPELVEAGRALSIRNCHVGNGALVERRNFSRLSRTATVDQGETDTRSHGEVTAILPLGSTLAIATEESRLYAPGASGTQWSEIERNEAPVSFKKALHSGTARDESSSGTHYRNPNLAIAGDWACVTWWRRSNGDDPGRGGGYALIYNMATGLTLRTERIAALIGIGTTGSTGSNPSLVPIALGSRFFVLYIDPTANEIKYKSFEPVVDTDWTSESTLVAVRAEGVDGSFDAVSTGSVAYVAYNALLSEGVTADLTALRATASGSTLVVSHTVQYAGSGYAPAIGVGTDGTLVCIAHTDSSGSVYALAALGTTLAVSTGGTRAQITSDTTTEFKQIACCVYQITDPAGGSERRATIVWSDEIDSGDGSSGDERYEYRARAFTVNLESVAGDTPVDIDTVNLSHRPFRLSGLATTACGAASFLGLRHNHALEDTYYTHVFSQDSETDESPPSTSVCTPVARYSGLTASYLKFTDESYSSSEQGVCAVAAYGGRYYWVGVEQVPYRRGTGVEDSRDTLHLYSLDFTRDRCWSAVQIDGHTLVAGSIPRMISPEVMSGESFTLARGLEGIVPLHSPLPFVSLSDVIVVGGTVANGTYYYCQTFEYTDVRGRTHRGAPSQPQSVEHAGGATAIELVLRDVDVPHPGYAHQKLVIWRSTANPADADNITFYRVAERDVGYVGATINDLLGDSLITGNEILYTVSGELENFPPPPSLALCLWKNRIVALDSETGKIWPSKTIIDREWPGFHEGLAISTDVHTSLPVFLTEDTDNLIVWWSDAIGVTYGEPGSDTGAPGSLTQPRLLGQRGIGLKYVKSLVRTQIGHMFMSERGIYLLGPDMSLTYIGEPVAAYNAHVIVGAYVVQTPLGSTEVRFETQGTDSYADGWVTLVYDLNKQGWHVHTRGRKPLAAASVAGRVYVATQASGTDTPWDPDGSPDVSGVWLESTSTTIPDIPPVDPPGLYSATLDTSWLAFAGKIGAARTRRLWMLGNFLNGFPDGLPTLQRPTVVRVYRDYDTTLAQTLTMNAVSNPRIIEGDYDVQDVTAVRMRISGFQRLFAMRVEVEVEKGATRRNNRLV